jgi:hypothetical protein
MVVRYSREKAVRSKVPTRKSKNENGRKMGVVAASVSLPGGLGYVFSGWSHRGSAGIEDE